MGCQFAKPKKKSLSEVVPSEQLVQPLPAVTVYGSESSIVTGLVRFALSFKTVSIAYVPSETLHSGSDIPVVLVHESDTVSGTCETLLRYVEDKFPNPPLLISRGAGRGATSVGIVSAATLQHRSVTWHVERLVTWAEDMATRGRRAAVDPALGSPRMEVKKFARSYSQLLEVMLEHAQMEERIVFPPLESADRGLCKSANEEHARDLPIMNGIKEYIKSIGVLAIRDSGYQEALFNLSTRLRTLQEHCQEHFEEEERDLWPLLEAVELSEETQFMMMEQCLQLMESTHSRLFSFMIEGLAPKDAMQYLDLMIRYGDGARVSLLLQSLLASKNKSSAIF
ncbi:hypothetical protein Syun_002526 [Stephania yunnanensis]|uniref:Hemerythrin-like domain-containing protein n=1 Tax=Stephania yunnanensis TaxID=152371 RepID=A0AAP0LFY8_9MAGN